jgi:hypothetical protein
MAGEDWLAAEGGFTCAQCHAFATSSLDIEHKSGCPFRVQRTETARDRLTDPTPTAREEQLADIFAQRLRFDADHLLSPDDKQYLASLFAGHRAVAIEEGRAGAGRPTATAPGVRADMPPLQPGDIVVATKGMRMGEIGTVVRYECDAPNGERQYRVEYHGVRECLTLEPFLLRVTNRLPNVPPLTCLECEESSNTRSPREMTCCAGCYAVLESRLTALLEAGAGRERPTNELEDLRVAFRSMTQQLDAIIPAAMAVLRDARDEGRADCRDSVDEEHIERLRQSIYAKYPKAEPADCASPTKENETCTESQASLTGSSSRPVPADTASSVTRSEWDASAADARSTPPTSEAADSSGPVTSFEGLEIQGETDVLLYIRVPKKRWQAFQEWERTANPLPKEK